MKNNIFAVKRIIEQLGYILSPSHKRRVIPLGLILLISSAFELLGVTLILPFVQAILSPEKLMKNPCVARILTTLNIYSANGTMILFGVCIILLYIIKNIFMIFSLYCQNDFSARVQKDLSVKMLRAYMNRPYEFFVETNSSVMLRGCKEDVTGVYATLGYIFDISSEILACVIIGIFIISSETFIALGVIALMILTFLAIIKGFKPAMKRLGIKMSDASLEQHKSLYQSIMGAKELMVMDRRELFLAKYENASDNMRKSTRNYYFLNSTPDRIVEGVCVSGLVGIVIIRLLLGADMTEFVPKLAAFAMAAFKILPSIGKISTRVNGMVHERVFVQDAYENLKASAEYEQELDEFQIETFDKNKNHFATAHFEKELNIDRVSWKYHNQETRVLDNISIRIQKGEAIALIGPSGAGKTTLADIILGLFKPQEGHIYMDGIDVFKIPHSWAKIVGYVPQTVFLMDDTIRSNIAFGEKEISDELIWEALEQAAIAEFVRHLPDGLDTIVGERGMKLSGGQRQRIAIARALYNKPEILVLDEATAALDNETEAVIMESIERLQGKITLIIVAHRLTTIKDCDRIYKIENKSVEEVKYIEIRGR